MKKFRLKYKISGLSTQSPSVENEIDVEKGKLVKLSCPNPNCSNPGFYIQVKGEEKNLKEKCWGTDKKIYPCDYMIEYSITEINDK